MAVEPLLDHGVKVGEGAGALLALPLVRAAAVLAAELPEREAGGAGVEPEKTAEEKNLGEEYDAT